MSSTNSKSAPRGNGSTRILQSPNCPWPPVCFLCRPCASVDDLIVSRYAIRGGFRFTSTPKRRLSLATVTSMCSWPWPDSSSSLVCGSRLYLIEGSSSSSRCIDVLILSSSPRLFGSIAYDSTGSGHVSGGNVNGSVLSPRVSLVRVSLSFATAPRSPALISGTFAGVLPCWSCRCPRRSGTSLVLLWTVESALTTPDTTRNIVIRPANGSATVFQTNTDAGDFSSAFRSCSAPLLSRPLNGRSDGEGT